MKLLKTLSVAALLFATTSAYSTHIIGGQIRVLSSEGLTCHIEIRFFANRGSDIKFGEGPLQFGDGSQVITPTKESQLIDFDLNIGVVVYRVDHTYAAPGIYKLTYQEPNLSGGIINIENSVEQRFYIETAIVLTETEVYQSPLFRTDPVFRTSINDNYSFSTAAIDSVHTDFYYQYELVSAFSGNHHLTIPENMKLNPDNGMLTWDGKYDGDYRLGLFWVIVKVSKFSKESGYLGFVQRAWSIFQEDMETTMDATSSIDDPDNKIVVTEGHSRKIKLVRDAAADIGGYHVYYNEALEENVTFSEYDSGEFKVASIVINTTGDVVADVPYPITLRAHGTFYDKDYTFLYLTKEEEETEEPEIVGLEDDKGELKVYPNPFYSELFVDATGEASLINSIGQVVMTSQLLHGQPLNTSQLPAGFYVLQIANRKIKLLRN